MTELFASLFSVVIIGGLIIMAILKRGADRSEFDSLDENLDEFFDMEAKEWEAGNNG